MSLLASPMHLLRTYHDVVRLNQILLTFSRYGFDYLLVHTSLHRLIRGRKAPAVDAASVTPQVNLRKAIEELGPAFIKFGQMLSTRRDLLPEPFIVELARLQDSVTPCSGQEARALVEAELGRPVTAVFSDFHEAAFAAASLAQVHRAVLRDGTPVVVKLRRPGVECTIATDLDIMEGLAGVLSQHVDELRRVNIRAMVAEFRKSITAELDFRRELLNALTLRARFAEDPQVHIPAVYRDLSTERMLVMEDIRGVRMENADTLRRAGLDPAAAARTYLGALARMVLEFGVFHADPHPGNVVVLPGNAVAFLDFGMVRRVDPDTRDLVRGIFTAAAAGDAGRLARTLARYAEPGTRPDVRAVARDVYELLSFYTEIPLRDLRLDGVARDAVRLLREHQLLVPSQLTVLMRVLTIAEGVAGAVAPDIRFTEEVAPIVQRVVGERFTLAALVREMQTFSSDAALAIRAMPDQLSTILEELSEGTLQVDFRHRGLEEPLSRLDRMVTRLALSITAGALFIGSAFIMRADHAPLLHRILSAVGLVAAVGLFVWLAVLIVRRK